MDAQSQAPELTPAAGGPPSPAPPEGQGLPPTGPAPSAATDVSFEVRTPPPGSDTPPTWPRPASGTVGPYELLQEVAQGGMGVVYQARHTRVGRIDALKMMRSDLLGRPQDARRFEVEMRAVAQLKPHPNVVRIYEVGLHRGQSYYTMAFLAGGSLAQHRSRLLEDPRAVVAVMEKVARGIQHAHDANIIHRDLKPANVMLDDAGEPHVTDFGLAKFLDGDLAMTNTGDVMGTVPYMAPEQAAGRAKDVGRMTDVWALGVMLFELLTGHKPFRGETSEEVRKRICTEEPPRPRSFRPDITPELEAVVLKCLEKDPARRFASAGALADELARWQRGDLLQTAPEGAWGRVKRAVRRRPRAAAMAICVGGAVLAAAAMLYLSDPERPRRAAERELRRGKAVTLVGPTGRPRWFRWRLAEGGALTDEQSPDGAFSVHTGASTVVELLPDPQQEAYRFQAEVRHLQGHEATTSEVGLAFGISHHPTAMAFYAFTFNDVTDLAALFPKGVLKGNPREVALRWWDRPEVAGLGRRYLKNFEPFRPAAAGLKNPWRKLGVEVRPLAVKFFWDDACLGEVSRDDLLAKDMNFRDYSPLPWHDIVRNLLPRQGLGLYLDAGWASFRNVTVEPLGSESQARETRTGALTARPSPGRRSRPMGRFRPLLTNGLTIRETSHEPES